MGGGPELDRMVKEHNLASSAGRSCEPKCSHASRRHLSGGGARRQRQRQGRREVPRRAERGQEQGLRSINAARQSGAACGAVGIAEGSRLAVAISGCLRGLDSSQGGVRRLAGGTVFVCVCRLVMTVFIGCSPAGFIVLRCTRLQCKSVMVV